MTDPRFSPFGTPLVEFDQLTMDERVRLLRADMAGWQYGHCSPYIGRSVAAAFDAFLKDGGDLARHLGLRPPKGSTATAGRIERKRERDLLLVRLTVAAGTAAHAHRILTGEAACPKACRPLVDALKAYAVPRSKAAISRAKVSRLR
jgi:hypothetical protein